MTSFQYTCAYVYICVYLYLYSYLYICACTYVYVYVHARTHTHLYIHETKRRLKMYLEHFDSTIQLLEINSNEKNKVHKSLWDQQFSFVYNSKKQGQKTVKTHSRFIYSIMKDLYDGITYSCVHKCIWHKNMYKVNLKGYKCYILRSILCLWKYSELRMWAHTFYRGRHLKRVTKMLTVILCDCHFHLLLFV